MGTLWTSSKGCPGHFVGGVKIIRSMFKAASWKNAPKLWSLEPSRGTAVETSRDPRIQDTLFEASGLEIARTGHESCPSGARFRVDREPGPSAPAAPGRDTPAEGCLQSPLEASSYRLLQGSCPLLTACHREATAKCPSLLTGPHRLESTILSDRLAAKRHHKHVVGNIHMTCVVCRLYLACILQHVQVCKACYIRETIKQQLSCLDLFHTLNCVLPHVAACRLVMR